MRPRAPGALPPAPPNLNPQIGRAFPTAEEGITGGTRHSRQVLVLNDTPFAVVAGFISGQTSIWHITHYDGTAFYWCFDPGADMTGGGYSVDLSDYSPTATAQQAAQYLAAKSQVIEAFVRAGTAEARNWPWKITAEQQTIGGVARWCVVFERGYPPGAPGTEASRATPILSIPQFGGNDGPHALINWYAQPFDPGERGTDLLPARFGFNRAVLPLAPSNRDTTTVIVPFEPPRPA